MMFSDPPPPPDKFIMPMDEIVQTFQTSAKKKLKEKEEVDFWDVRDCIVAVSFWDALYNTVLLHSAEPLTEGQLIDGIKRKKIICLSVPDDVVSEVELDEKKKGVITPEQWAIRRGHKQLAKVIKEYAMYEKQQQQGSIQSFQQQNQTHNSQLSSTSSGWFNFNMSLVELCMDKDYLKYLYNSCEEAKKGEGKFFSKV